MAAVNGSSGQDSMDPRMREDDGEFQREDDGAQSFLRTRESMSHPSFPLTRESVPTQQVRAVDENTVHPIWRAWWAVAVLLLVIFSAYAWRSYDFLQDRVSLQTKAVASLARIQVINTFPLVDKSLMSAKTAFESLGPGIDETALSMVTATQSDAGMASFKCMVLVNSAGDPYLRTPELCQLPDMTDWAEEVRLSVHYDAQTIYTKALIEPDSGRQFLVRGIPLHFKDESFAGMAIASLDTDQIFSLFNEFGTGAFKNSFLPMDATLPSLAGFKGRFASGLNSPINMTADMPVRVSTPNGPGQLLLQVGSSRQRIAREWILGILPPFVGMVMVLALLGYWARTTHKALKRRIKSDLMLQQTRMEAQVQARFFANMSHELRTPMNGVIVASELLSQTRLDAQQAHLVGLITRSGTLLVNIVNDILDSGKISAGQMNIESEDFNVLETLKDVADLLRPQAAAKQLQFELDLQIPVNLHAKSDAKRLQQVVINLLSNAIKFTASGHIGFSARVTSPITAPKQAVLTIDIEDTGIGFDMAKADWLYKPFQQADSSISRRFGGTGLGLSISQQLVRLLGGTIRVTSAPGQGSQFTVQIPLNQTTSQLPSGPSMEPLTVHDDTAVALSDPNASKTFKLAGVDETALIKQLELKVLVAEDNSINLQLIQILLKSLQCDVEIAHNGQEAVDIASQTIFDVILMDCQMPVMDGREATRQIRLAGSQTPIIALTAQTQTEDIQQCLGAGMIDYCPKPINKSLLIKLLIKHGFPPARERQQDSE